MRAKDGGGRVEVVIRSAGLISLMVATFLCGVIQFGIYGCEDCSRRLVYIFDVPASLYGLVGYALCLAFYGKIISLFMISALIGFHLVIITSVPHSGCFPCVLLIGSGVVAFVAKCLDCKEGVVRAVSVLSLVMIAGSWINRKMDAVDFVSPSEKEYISRVLGEMEGEYGGRKKLVFFVSGSCDYCKRIHEVYIPRIEGISNVDVSVVDVPSGISVPVVALRSRGGWKVIHHLPDLHEITDLLAEPSFGLSG